MADTNTYTPASEDPTIDLATSQPDNEAPNTMPDTITNTNTNTNPFEDPITDLATALPDPEAPDTNTNTNNTNPFVDPIIDFATPDPGTTTRARGSSNHSIPPCDDDDDDESDSVRSMLEMMETKDRPRHNPANKSKSRRSDETRGSAKWRWKSPPSLLGRNRDDDDDDEGEEDDDDASLRSYDCIALASLRAMTHPKRRGDSNRNSSDEEDDEESLRSKPTGFRNDDDDDAKSDGTTTTKNSGNRSEDDVPSSPWHPRNRRRTELKYIVLFASFLATLLLLGILVLSYSLYALRHEEYDENLSIFGKDFWRKDIPNTIAFWEKDDGEQ